MRRSFLKKSAALAAFFGLHKSGFSFSEMENQLERLDDTPVSSVKPVIQLKVPLINPMKVGLIGLGNRGLEHLRLLNLNDQDSVMTPLSAISCELGSIPVRFPDFTSGQWKEQRMPGVMSNW